MQRSHWHLMFRHFCLKLVSGNSTATAISMHWFVRSLKMRRALRRGYASTTYNEHIVTARVRSTREGNAYTWECLSTRGRGGVPHPLSKVRTGGYLIPGQDGGYPPLRSGWYSPVSRIWYPSHIQVRSQDAFMKEDFLVTACIQRMTEGNVFTLSIISGGYPISGLDGEGGYPIPDLDQGYPIPGLDRGDTPSQVWTRGGTPSQVWIGGIPYPAGGRVPSSKIRLGVPWGSRLDGITPPPSRLDGVPPIEDWMGQPPHPRLDATWRAVCLLRSRRRLSCYE